MNGTEVPDTKEKILDTAEKLFAVNGYSVTSLRHITSEAGVNLAAINYHFKSKEGLLLEVLHRRLDPMNRERMELLDELEAAGDRSVEKTVRAMLEPVFRMKDRDGEHSIRILGKLHSEPAGVPQELIADLFLKVFNRFNAAFTKALPQLPEDERVWRLHFVIGSMAHTLISSVKLEKLTCGLCDTGDSEAMVERLVAFATAGLTAPLPAVMQGGTGA